ncbi:hypothetical protein ACFOY8_12390 [Thalassospira xianhensis]|uniref:Uncharacterized protein n=1 Tax=Thalassospira xianhensis MCCC 1A02616 TaxID=1177929 RepID=A0A367UDE0_9PROT|nr:hypothetical protein [Thalassospira xianhensis]RCK06337.1 hypothetical protein TH5_09045 [Thalassospira xianhensis MCCC 1A02616]
MSNDNSKPQGTPLSRLSEAKHLNSLIKMLDVVGKGDIDEGILALSVLLASDYLEQARDASWLVKIMMLMAEHKATNGNILDVRASGLTGLPKQEANSMVRTVEGLLSENAALKQQFFDASRDDISENDVTEARHLWAMLGSGPEHMEYAISKVAKPMLEEVTSSAPSM